MSSVPMRVGIDFDNTIVCYDGVFHRVAVERGLIPAGVDMAKGGVRDYLRAADQEDDWIELQGHVYGTCMREVATFPGVPHCLAAWRRAGISAVIISHKTRFPYRGPAHDLHRAAQEWLEQQGFFDTERIGLSREQVFFELTKEAKLERIAALACTHFIDDLPEFLDEPNFPAAVERILFDSHGLHLGERRFRRVGSWTEAETLLLAAATGNSRWVAKP